MIRSNHLYPRSRHGASKSAIRASLEQLTFLPLAPLTLPAPHANIFPARVFKWTAPESSPNLRQKATRLRTSSRTKHPACAGHSQQNNRPARTSYRFLSNSLLNLRSLFAISTLTSNSSPTRSRPGAEHVKLKSHRAPHTLIKAMASPKRQSTSARVSPASTLCRLARPSLFTTTFSTVAANN